MNERSVVIIGLPESGKTTFLAALWHLITERDVPTVLSLDTLGSGERSHLNQISARWRDAKIQDRTETRGNRLVSMNLKDATNIPVQIAFPDVAGEAYQRMWEERDCDPAIAELLKSSGVLLFIHADTIRPPKWIVDEVALSVELGLPVPNGDAEVPWHPRLAPTQVQLVDLLQLLRSAPLDIGPRRLVIMLSAWDKVEAEGLSPQRYLQEKLPLLAQYLRRAVDGWAWRIYGLSAQGGDYDRIEEDAMCKPEAEKLRNLDRPSTRIRLIQGMHEADETHDLTEPLAWLME